MEETEIDEALNKARAMLGVNYYIDSIAKEYIQKFKMEKTKVLCSKIPQSIPRKKDQISLHIRKVLRRKLIPLLANIWIGKL